MKRAGDILREERLKQGKTLKEISQVTRVRVDFLQFVEEGKYSRLPDPVYARGFIVSFTQALNLDPERVLPFYRREQEDEQDLKVKDIPQPVESTTFRLTPRKLAIGVISIALTVFLVVLFIQYQKFSGLPVLVVTSPTDNLITTQPFVEVLGNTDSKAKIFVNGELVTPSIDGHFGITFQLNQGINYIKITAESELGKKNVVERVVERREE